MRIKLKQKGLFPLPILNLWIGLQLQRRLVEGSKPVPIIFLRAWSSVDEDHQALQAYAVQFSNRFYN